MLVENKAYYDRCYSKEQSFLRYPADWVIRFYNMFLKKEVPQGRVLDYGCGSANNTVLFAQKGYETYGVEVTSESIPLIRKNFESYGLPTAGLEDRFLIVDPDTEQLPFADAMFDFILSNQVLYYLMSEERIRTVATELKRCLRPGGIVFFTMMATSNYYIQEHGKSEDGGQTYQVTFDGTHRLSGLKQHILPLKDETHCKRLFDMFEPLSIGYFDQKMFDMTSNFHWIFVGRK